MFRNYYGRKDYFEQEQQADNLRMRISSRDSLKSDLHYASNIPTTSVDTLPYQEILMAVRANRKRLIERV